MFTLYTSARACMCVCTHMHAPEDNLGCSSDAIHSFGETKSLGGSALAWQVRLLASESQGSMHLHLPSAKIINRYCRPHLTKMCVLGTPWTQLLLCQLSYLHRPNEINFK